MITRPATGRGPWTKSRSADRLDFLGPRAGRSFDRLVVGNGGRSSAGRAPACGAGGRGFEPRRSPSPSGPRPRGRGPDASRSLEPTTGQPPSRCDRSRSLPDTTASSPTATRSTRSLRRGTPAPPRRSPVLLPRRRSPSSPDARSPPSTPVGTEYASGHLVLEGGRIVAVGAGTGTGSLAGARRSLGRRHRHAGHARPGEHPSPPLPVDHPRLRAGRDAVRLADLALPGLGGHRRGDGGSIRRRPISAGWRCPAAP